MWYMEKITLFLPLLVLLSLSSCDGKLQLKTDITTQEYELFLNTEKIHFEDSDKPLTFNGTVRIKFEVGKSTGKEYKLVLNIANETKILGLEVKDNKGKTLRTKYFTDKKLLHIVPEISENKAAEVIINFNNPFGNDMTGFYRSSYESKVNGKRWLLTSHFEPIFARDAFPCFDRPNLKAYFIVKISVPKSIVNKGYVVLSNTPQIPKKIEKNDSFIYEFERTPSPMSTYLAAFTIADFISTPPLKFDGEKIIRTYGRKEIINNKEAELSQIAAKEALDELSKYLGIKYKFPKVDQVGIPDFSAGAMENWGHISFREKSLYFNDFKTSTPTKQANVLTITHELVHQWFGNLVTLESWDYIWLNEAFATYLGYVISAKFVNPKLNTVRWGYMEQFLTNEMHFRAFETDGFETSKQLSNKIEDENLIFASFNDIPYSKGASVVRMWDLAQKNDGFRKSLENYLNNRKENSANPDHLYQAFSETVKMDKTFFSSWHEKPGYPVIEVKRINGSHYSLTQKRFLWENSSVNDTSLWTVPITFSTSNSKNFVTQPQLFLKSSSEIIYAPGDWIIVNNQQAGYYRVNYEKENWEKLSKALKQSNYSNIHELNRAQIVNDIFSLARSVQKNYVHYSTALSLSEYLKNENSYIVWRTALNAFDFLKNKIYKDASIYNKIQTHILKLIEPHFKVYNLNSTTKDHVGKLMSIEVSRWACDLDHEPCIKSANELYHSSRVSSLPDTREIILCTVIKNNDTVWNEVFKKYQLEEDSAQKIVYLLALGCSSNKTIIEKFLNKSLEINSEIRKQDLMFVLSSVYNGNVKNIELAFNFIEKNFVEIAKLYGGINPLGRALLGISKKLNSEEDLKRMKILDAKIQKSNVLHVKAAKDSVKSALGIITSNIKWMDERKDQFKTYVTAHY